MKTVHPYAAGLDIGKKLVVVCIRTPKHRETRTFGMTTHYLLEMADWLSQHGVTHVAMESTGVYWKPIYNLLEGSDFELALVHPRDSKNVPGRFGRRQGCRVAGRSAPARPAARQLCARSSAP